MSRGRCLLPSWTLDFRVLCRFLSVQQHYLIAEPSEGGLFCCMVGVPKRHPPKGHSQNLLEFYLNFQTSIEFHRECYSKFTWTFISYLKFSFSWRPLGGCPSISLWGANYIRLGPPLQKFQRRRSPPEPTPIVIVNGIETVTRHLLQYILASECRAGPPLVWLLLRYRGFARYPSEDSLTCDLPAWDKARG